MNNIVLLRFKSGVGSNAKQLVLSTCKNIAPCEFSKYGINFVTFAYVYVYLRILNNVSSWSSIITFVKNEGNFKNSRFYQDKNLHSTCSVTTKKTIVFIKSGIFRKVDWRVLHFVLIQLSYQLELLV